MFIIRWGFRLQPHTLVLSSSGVGFAAGRASFSKRRLPFLSRCHYAPYLVLLGVKSFRGHVLPSWQRFRAMFSLHGYRKDREFREVMKGNA